jgi:21S rRNA (GM2251-2'-O)-methyltransferase
MTLSTANLPLCHYRKLLLRSNYTISCTVYNQLRRASLASIHRGIHRAERLKPPTSNQYKATPRSSTRIGGRRDVLSVRKNTSNEPTEQTGRQTRSKRFHDPQSSFGKRSLVYRLKFGDLKQKGEDLLQNRQSSIADRKRLKTSEQLRFAPQHIRTPRRTESIASSNTARYRRQESSTPTESPSSPRKPGFPLSINYTTAASQFLYGKSVVEAALRERRRKLYHLYVYETDSSGSSKHSIKSIAAKLGVPITIVDARSQSVMDKMSAGRPHNGFVLEASPLPQLPSKGLAALLKDSKMPGFHISLGHQSKEEAQINGTNDLIHYKNQTSRNPLVLLLDEVLDPGNLGGMLRTACFLGVAAVAITKTGSSSLSPTALKAAAGAAEELTILSVENAADFLEQSKKCGWVTYAAVAPTTNTAGKGSWLRPQLSIDMIEARSPLAQNPCILVLGNEGKGISKAIRAQTDFEVCIPRPLKFSNVDSLNVSVATGLLCHAFLRVRDSHIPPSNIDVGKRKAGSAVADDAAIF